MSPAMPARLLLLALALGAGAAAFAGCGGAPKSVEAPAGKSAGEEPETLSEAEALLDRSEDDLHAALLAPGEPKTREGLEPPGRESEPMPYAERPAQSRDERRCATACRALGSMDRAASRLCELAGSGDARCEGARMRVDAARDLVRRSCPACSA